MVMWKLTGPVALMPVVGPVQVDAGTESAQLKVTVPVNPVAKVTFTVASTLEPCDTWKLGEVVAIVNGAVTVTDEAVELDVFSVALPA